MTFKVGDITTNVAGNAVEIIHDLHSGPFPLIGVINGVDNANYSYDGVNSNGLPESNLVEIVSEFYVGELVTVGTKDHLPGNDSMPWPARVICIDAKDNQNCSVIVLATKYGRVNEEALMSFGINGESTFEMAFGAESLGYNLYHKAEH